MLIYLFALIDIHTLFILLTHNNLSPIYVFSGSSFALLKGGIFFILSKDILSFFDIIVSFIMMFLLIGNLFTILYWIIGIYLVYKIIMSFAAF